jgi:hypothetical protein
VAAPLTIALSLPPTAFADTPSWSGEYAITFMVGPKSGTSMPEANGTLVGVMHTDILSGPCQGWIEMDMTAERA